MDIKEYLTTRRQQIESWLGQFLVPEQEGRLADHFSALRYSLLAGGKRVRPILCMAAAEALGADPTPYLAIACSLECIHTYSLIHDDLPAMDNDDLRRGKPTNHKVFGEAEAILAGDGLLTIAFELLSAPLSETLLSANDRLRIIHIIAVAAGSRGMVGGQSLDIASEGRQISLARLKNIHSCKTGALITASVQSGAVLGGANQDQFTALTEYGNGIGLAFQMTDDILNVEGTTEQLGKAAGSDEERHKATYPALLGLDESKREVTTVIERAIAALDGFSADANPLRELARYILNRKR